jgi:hypothetical protein
VPLVAPEFRPTLRDELAPLPARTRWAVIGVLAVVVLALLVLALRGGGTGGARSLHTGPVTFNLLHPPEMRKLPPAPGELLHLERKGLDSFIVEPLHLPAYRGDVGGYLPIQAALELAALRKRFPQLEPVEEGKARVNQVAGYSLAFRARRSPTRLYGRLVLLPQPVPGARDGVKLLLLATPDGGADKARDVGTRGLLKTPFRSFRFGTEGP